MGPSDGNEGGQPVDDQRFAREGKRKRTMSNQKYIIRTDKAGVFYGEITDRRGSEADKEERDNLVASIIMRDPVQREGYTETRSNEKDEEELWRMVDGH